MKLLACPLFRVKIRGASLKALSSHAIPKRGEEIRRQNFIDPMVTYKDLFQKASIDKVVKSQQNDGFVKRSRCKARKN